MATIAASTLQFDEATHSYSVAGRRYPSVTQVLQATGLADVDWMNFIDAGTLEHARERGVRVHQACALLLKGTLDWATIDDAIEGYVLAFDQFLRETKFTAAAQDVERRFYCQEHGYCGTFDAVGLLSGKRTLLDFKSGSMDAVRWQLAAYAAPAMAFHRAAVQLTRDGKYRMKWFAPETLRGDFGVFTAALTVEKAKNGGYL